MINNITTNIEPNGAKKIMTTSFTEGEGKSDIPATKTINNLATQVGFLRWVTISIALLVGLGFILNLFDIYDYRVKYFQQYKEKVEELEKQNINFENRLLYNTVTKQEKDDLEKIINTQQMIIDCLRSKKYWQYEECFK